MQNQITLTAAAPCGHWRSSLLAQKHLIFLPKMSFKPPKWLELCAVDTSWRSRITCNPLNRTKQGLCLQFVHSFQVPSSLQKSEIKKQIMSRNHMTHCLVIHPHCGVYTPLSLSYQVMYIFFPYRNRTISFYNVIFHFMYCEHTLCRNALFIAS